MIIWFWSICNLFIRLHHTHQPFTVLTDCISCIHFRNFNNSVFLPVFSRKNFIPDLSRITVIDFQYLLDCVTCVTNTVFSFYETACFSWFIFTSPAEKACICIFFVHVLHNFRISIAVYIIIRINKCNVIACNIFKCGISCWTYAAVCLMDYLYAAVFCRISVTNLSASVGWAVICKNKLNIFICLI